MRFNIRSHQSDKEIASWFMCNIAQRCNKDSNLEITIFYGIKESYLEKEQNNYIIRVPQYSIHDKNNEKKAFDSLGTSGFEIEANGVINYKFDIISFCAASLGRLEEQIIDEEDDTWNKHSQYRVEASTAYQLGFCRKPYVDILIKKLLNVIDADRDAFGAKPIQLEKPWQGKNWGCWLTHDVDMLSGRYCLGIRIIWFTLQAIKNLLNNKLDDVTHQLRRINQWIKPGLDPYYSFPDIISLEKSYGATSTFYFMALRYGISPKDGIRYPFKHKLLRTTLNLLNENGFSIGLHPAYNNPFDDKYLREQKGDLENVSGLIVNTVRNHYLRVHYPHTWRIQSKNGFSLSSNMGWSAFNGFRAGTCWPYIPWDVKENRPIDIIEVPLLVMDHNLAYPDQVLNDFIEIAEEVRAVKGLMVINYHSHHWAGVEYPHGKSIYENMVLYASNEGCSFINPSYILKLKNQMLS